MYVTPREEADGALHRLEQARPTLDGRCPEPHVPVAHDLWRRPIR